MVESKKVLLSLSVISLMIFSVSFVSAASWWCFWCEDDGPSLNPVLGTLKIGSEPGKANVYVNQSGLMALFGTTGDVLSDPLVISLSEGKHYIKVNKSGYANYTTYVDIESGKTVVRDVKLVKLNVSNAAICGNRIVETGETCDSNSRACALDGKNGSQNCNSSCNGFGSCVVGNQTAFCTDEDGGKNYNVAGNFTNKTGTFKDWCNSDGKTLYEGYCNSDGTSSTEMYTCPNGCMNGACKPAVNVCGNSVKEGTEECDDGNTNDVDRCTNSCKILSTPAECKLISANWTNVVDLKVQENQLAYLNISGQDCEGLEVIFDVIEEDFLSSDDAVRVIPPNGKFNNGQASSRWKVEGTTDEDFSKPEYYFMARLAGDNAKLIRSPLLRVI